MPTTTTVEIRKELSDAAHVAHSAAITRRAAALAELEKAEAAAKAATEASETIAGDPVTLARAERDANDLLIFARRAVDIAERQVADATAALKTAWGEAHRPIHDEGKRIRLEATKRGDAALRELAAARTDYASGTKLIHAARAEGCPATAGVDGALFNGPMPSEYEERIFWSTVRGQ